MMKNIEMNLNKALGMFNINTNVTVNEEDVMTEEDKAMTQIILDNCDAIEEAMAPVDIIADLEAYIEEEAERLHTAELLNVNKDEEIAIYESIIKNEELVSIYGNKTIKRHRELVSALNKIPTGCDKSLIEITMNAKGCKYPQAVSKLAQVFNIDYDKETWFKSHLEIIEHNRKLVNNPTEIVIKYPQLWSKMKHNAHMKKYFIFLLDLMQTQLEYKGVSQRGKMPLISSASCGFISRALGVGYKTAYVNMNNLTMFGATKKLTDKEVEAIDESRYESIIKLAGGVNQTITTYELVLWTDEVLSAMNDMIIEKQRTRATRDGQCHASLEVIGCGDVINKSNKELSAKDKANIASLKKWCRDKIRWSGFITQDDWTSRFNNKSNKNTIWAKKHIRDMYETIVMAQLGLTYEYATNELKAIMNSKKLNQVKHQCKVWVPVNISNQLHKYNN